MPFVVEPKELKLDSLGEHWKGASLFFNPLSFREVQELAALDVDENNPNAKANKKSFEQTSEMVKDKFVRGTAWDGESLVPVTKDNVLDLPVSVIQDAIKLLTSGTTPN